MQLLLEFFPVIAFLIAYKVSGAYAATATMMVAMLLSVAISWLRTRRVTPLLGASTALVLVLGTATLILRDIRFIQWKPSVLLWMVALAFLVSAFVGKQPLAQKLLQPTLGETQLARPDWLKLNAAFVVYGVVIGFVNIVVAYQASEATWVNVKVYGLPASMFLFMVGLMFWLHLRGKLNHE
jgi:intracellular septation protein